MRLKKILIYNCETLKLPSECGWGNYEDIGISCIGICCNYVSFLPKFRTSVFREDKRGSLRQFGFYSRRADVVVGFNSRSFDDLLCKANKIKVKTDIDLLEEIRVLSGQPAVYTPGETRGGYSLDKISRANFGEGKIQVGSSASLLWQQGEKDKVIDYCLNNVMLTKKIYDAWLGKEKLIDPTTGKNLFA